MINNSISEDSEFKSVNSFARMKAFKPSRNPGRRHVGRKVIVSGRPAEIDIVMQAAAAAPGSTISPVPDPNSLCFNDFSFLAAEGRLSDYTGLEVRQYSLTGKEDESDIWQAIKTIYESALNAKGGPYMVFADPNLITGNSVGGGSGGASGGPGGTAVGIPGDGAKGITPAGVFCQHWAFGPQQADPLSPRWGMNLEDAAGRRQVTGTGAGERIFLLDTFDPPLNSTGITLPGSPCEKAGQSIHLLVSTLSEGAVEKDAPPAFTGSSKNVEAHGIYVCGLAHRVAPDSELHLVQILNNFGQGELFTLAKVLTAVADFGMQKPLETEPDLPLSNMVVNMSLEANFSEEMVLTLGVREAIQNLWKSIEARYDPKNILQRLLREMTKGFFYLPSLRLPIQILNRMGAVIVAAAGNESVDYYGHLPMSIPARYTEVLGVAGTNYLGKLANFSNIGDVCAPGGGVEEPEDPIEDVSEIIAAGRNASLLAMVSIVPQDADGEFQDGFAYWWGTSFATPLVSGLAALIQEKIRTSDGKRLSPDDVMERIKASVRNGVINVVAALS